MLLFHGDEQISGCERQKLDWDWNWWYYFVIRTIEDSQWGNPRDGMEINRTLILNLWSISCSEFCGLIGVESICWLSSIHMYSFNNPLMNQI
jgi:hypothetical protein